MNRRLIIPTLLLAAVAAGCGGVDRAGTKQHIIDSLAKTGVSAEQKKCVANVIDKFTDDELKQLDSGKASDALTTKMSDAVTSCILGDTSGSTTVPDVATTEASTATTSARSTATTTAAATTTEAATTTFATQLFESDFEPACRGVKLSKAAAYAPTAGQVSPALLFVGKGSKLDQNVTALPDEWTIQWKSDSDALTGIQVVACADRTSETFAKECTGYTVGNSTESDGVVEFFDATYDVTIHSAKTGEVLGKGSVDAKAEDCPFAVTFSDGAKTTNEYATDDAAFQSVLKPYVQP